MQAWPTLTISLMTLKANSSDISYFPLGQKYLSKEWEMISTIPQPVWYFETEKVNSGFKIAKLGRIKSLLKPSFNPSLSLEMTQEEDNSLPEAAKVRITPIGNALVGLTIYLLKSYGSPS